MENQLGRTLDMLRTISTFEQRFGKQRSKGRVLLPLQTTHQMIRTESKNN